MVYVMLRELIYMYDWGFLVIIEKNSYKILWIVGYMYINRNCLIRKIFGKWIKNKLNLNFILWKDGILYLNKFFYFNLVFYKYFLYILNKLLV